MKKLNFSKFAMPTNDLLDVAIACARLSSDLVNSDTNNDGKTTISEVTLAVLTNVGGISVIVTKSKSAFIAFKTSTITQRRDVIAGFAEVFDLNNDEAEVQIETVLSEVNEIASAVLRLIQKFKKNKQVPTA